MRPGCLPLFLLRASACALLLAPASRISSAEPEPAKPPRIRVTVDFGKPLGRISPNVFGTNDLESVNITKWQGKGWVWDAKTDPGFQDLMAQIACPMVRIHLMDKMDSIFPARGAAPDWSAVDCMDRTFSRRPRQRIMFCFTKEPAWMDLTRAEDRTLFAKDCAALANHLVNEKHYPIDYWDFYNEPYHDTPPPDGKLDVDRSFWQLYNLMATALHAVTPGVKVGGPGLASPDTHIMEDFLAHCAANVDFITWHYYPSGKETVPTEDLLDQTKEFGGDVRKMRSLAEKYIPGKKTDLILGEYNMCWAWTPSDPRQAQPVGAVWIASVLKNIIDARADAAMTWHAYGNGSFGLISAANEIRPSGTLLGWLNRWVAGATQVRAQSTGYNMEVLAATSETCDIVLLINKVGELRNLSLAFAGAAPGPRPGTLCNIADGQPVSTQPGITLFDNGHATERITMPAYSLRLYILEKNTKDANSNAGNATTQRPPPKNAVILSLLKEL